LNTNDPRWLQEIQGSGCNPEPARREKYFMDTNIKISKLDAAKRQLETAILLYFNSADPVSIHTLTGAAHGILSDLIEDKGGSSLIKLSVKTLIKKEYQKEVGGKITLARNHFKHANQNPDFVLDFNPEGNDIFLHDACTMYQALTSERIPYLDIFIFWYVLHNQKFFNLSSEDKTLYKEFLNVSKMDFFTQMISAKSPLIK